MSIPRAGRSSRTARPRGLRLSAAVVGAAVAVLAGGWTTTAAADETHSLEVASAVLGPQGQSVTVTFLLTCPVGETFDPSGSIALQQWVTPQVRLNLYELVVTPTVCSGTQQEVVLTATADQALPLVFRDGQVVGTHPGRVAFRTNPLWIELWGGPEYSNDGDGQWFHATVDVTRR